MGGMTFIEAAESVLGEMRHTVTAEQLWAEIERRGLVQTKGKRRPRPCTRR